MEKQPQRDPRIVPMSGKEVETMFGDDSVLKAEAVLETVNKEILDIQNVLNGEDDPDEQEVLRMRIQDLREERTKQSRDVRNQQKDFGKKRGPITL